MSAGLSGTLRVRIQRGLRCRWWGRRGGACRSATWLEALRCRSIGFPDARSPIAVHHPSKRTGLACSLQRRHVRPGLMGLMRLMHAFGAKLGEIHPFALGRELGTVIPTQY